ncbi:hypothetical protein [Aquabacterium sp.]|uniref:hypothetical protein n=1 Tax=Aquabacterium sp. TaxID=1872578 RepID=UPI002C2786B3|nr:hypothetical protein [Aquabacterium sp.]HSW06942.1 hypothetical protein [Aquabacterium sp.]
MPTVNTNSVSLYSVDLASMDIESALMAVQTQRANMLEDQLKDQMLAVQQRNTTIMTLNNILAAVREVRPSGDATEEADTSDGGAVQIPTEDYIAAQQDYVELLTSMRNANQSTLDGMSPGSEGYATAEKLLINSQASLNAATINLNNAMSPGAGATTSIGLNSALATYGFTSGTLTQSEFDQLINNITSRIDGLNSSQQMDMLRLQSLTNKRNESFDIMTNFIKKLQDNRSSIIGNLR